MYVVRREDVAVAVEVGSYTVEGATRGDEVVVCGWGGGRRRWGECGDGVEYRDRFVRNWLAERSFVICRGCRGWRCDGLVGWWGAGGWGPGHVWARSGEAWWCRKHHTGWNTTVWRIAGDCDIVDTRR